MARYFEPLTGQTVDTNKLMQGEDAPRLAARVERLEALLRGCADARLAARSAPVMCDDHAFYGPPPCDECIRSEHPALAEEE